MVAEVTSQQPDVTKFLLQNRSSWQQTLVTAADPDTFGRMSHTPMLLHVPMMTSIVM